MMLETAVKIASPPSMEQEQKRLRDRNRRLPRPVEGTVSPGAVTEAAAGASDSESFIGNPFHRGS